MGSTLSSAAVAGSSGSHVGDECFRLLAHGEELDVSVSVLTTPCAITMSVAVSSSHQHRVRAKKTSR
jgi:hypothetical protein